MTTVHASQGAPSFGAHAQVYWSPSDHQMVRKVPAPQPIDFLGLVEQASEVVGPSSCRWFIHDPYAPTGRRYLPDKEPSWFSHNPQRWDCDRRPRLSQLGSTHGSKTECDDHYSQANHPARPAGLGRLALAGAASALHAAYRLGGQFPAAHDSRGRLIEVLPGGGASFGTHELTNPRLSRLRSSHGEVTEGDDMPPKKQGSQKRKPITRKPQKPKIRSRQQQPRQTAQVMAPVALGTATTFTKGQMRQTKDGMILRHRELVYPNIAGSVAFAVQASISVNPGLLASFPWASPIATQFEQYRVRRLTVEYIPSCPSTTQGDVNITVDYDASDLQPTSEVQAVDTVGARQFQCWMNQSVSLDTKDMMALGPRRFVREAPIGGDIKTYDVANIYISTQNMTSTANVGKIWLSYEFELFVPQTQQRKAPPAAFGAVPASFYINAVNQPLISGSQPVVFGTMIYDSLGWGPAGTGFLPPAGRYAITFSCSIEDDALEPFQVEAQFFRAGLGYQYAWTSANGGAAASKGNLTVTSVLAFNGSQLFAVQVTLYTGTSPYILDGSAALTILPVS